MVIGYQKIGYQLSVFGSQLRGLHVTIHLFLESSKFGYIFTKWLLTDN